MSGTLLHLLRHGACEVPGLLVGHRDMASTPAGIAACAARAEGIEIEAIVASDLARSARAAEFIAAARGLSVTFDPRWRELDFGAWDGRAVAEIDPDALSRFWDDPEADPPPGGERRSALVARVAAAIVDLPPRPTLVVTHGGAMRAALSALCGLDHGQGWALDLPYAALLSLRIWRGDRPSDPMVGQIVGLRT